MSIEAADASLLWLRFSGLQGDRPMQIFRQDPPWRVVRPFVVGERDSLVHIHNLSGGILSGDRLELVIEVREGARAQLTSTGATRIYKHREGREISRISSRVSVGKSALLEYLPDQTIPYAKSRYFQETTIDLAAEDAGLFCWEILTAGRAGYGERFSYSSLEMRFMVSCDGEPLAIDQFVIDPMQSSPHQHGIFGNYECCSTFYICKTGLDDHRWTELESMLEDEVELLSSDRMQWGASRLLAHGIVMRGVGMHASQMLSALNHFWRVAKLYLYGREAVPPRKVH